VGPIDASSDGGGAAVVHGGAVNLAGIVGRWQRKAGLNHI
jgi:hypothetical protein